VNHTDEIIPSGIEAEDAQALAKAIVLSMLADVDRPGDRTSSLLSSALGRPTELDRARAITTAYMLADIATAAIELLSSLGIDVRGELASPYLMPEDIS